MTQFNILIISNYPTPSNPQASVFVFRLVQEMVDLGHKLTVISPKKITFRNIFLKFPYSDKATVYQPFFISCSDKNIGSFNTNSLTHKFKVNAIERILRTKRIDYDVIYCHFWASGFIAADALANHFKPFIIAFGDSESQFKATLSLYSDNCFRRLLKLASGYISVSNENIKNLLKYNVDPANILLVPNAADANIFYPRDKGEMRKKYQIPENRKIVIFVGGFSSNKGYQRVLLAIKDLNEVYGIFLGKGEIKNDYGKVLFKGLVKHFQVAEMLSCADVFVLPTQDEGSSNAIVEAMACGLPIISSDIPAIREQCNPSFSILVGPNDVEQIKNAIASIIYDNYKLHAMRENAIDHSKKYTLKARAKKISDFLEKFN